MSRLDVLASFLRSGPAVFRLLFLRGPSAVSRLIVAVRIRVAVLSSCRSAPFPHVTEERPRSLAPAFENSNATSSIVLVLIAILVPASLDHIPPTGVRRFVAIASQCLTITQFSLRVIADAAAQYATRETNGLPGLWVFHSPPHEHPAPILHLDGSTQFWHGLATGASATRRVSAAEICSLDRHFSTTFNIDNERRLSRSESRRAAGRLAGRILFRLRS